MTDYGTATLIWKFRFNSWVAHLLRECLPLLIINFNCGYTQIPSFIPPPPPPDVWPLVNYINQVYVYIFVILSSHLHF